MTVNVTQSLILRPIDIWQQWHVVSFVCLKRFALCYQTVFCLSVMSSSLSVCLSVTLEHCGQTVGWIKMKLRTEVGLIPGHIVLDGGEW